MKTVLIAFALAVPLGALAQPVQKPRRALRPRALHPERRLPARSTARAARHIAKRNESRKNPSY